MDTREGREKGTVKKELLSLAASGVWTWRDNFKILKPERERERAPKREPDWKFKCRL